MTEEERNEAAREFHRASTGVIGLGCSMWLIPMTLLLWLMTQ